uniref:C-type lectin domain-containing protein n=1 Tax=Oncorhynchus tshawytscha TaxID=74940 RepID=A0A8C8G6C3_ONCTS
MELSMTLFLLSGLYTLLSSSPPLLLSSSHEYQFVNISKTWAEAQSYCREKYIDLATIDNTEDVARLSKIFNGFSGIKDRVWIGLYDNIKSWKWSLNNSDYYNDGAEYGNWNVKEPNNLGSSQYCVAIEQNGLWNDRACALELYPVCYDANATNRYILGERGMNWTVAQSYCRQYHTDLATVRNQTENWMIQDMISTSQVWFGLSRVPWRWSDRSNSSFRLWGRDQPNNYLSIQQCVVMSEKTGLWDDVYCGDEHPFLCHRGDERKQRTVNRMKIHSC